MSYEMTTSVRFYLSYDPLKYDFSALKMNIISIRKRFVDTSIVNDFMCSCQVLLHMWLYDFYEKMLSTE